MQKHTPKRRTRCACGCLTPDSRPRGHHLRVHREPLPPGLGHIFRVRDARGQGVPVDRLQAIALDRSVWGMRREGAADSLRARCELFAARLRDDAVISHTTAAMLYGAPLDFTFERDDRLHFTTPAPGSAPHARGLVGHLAQLAPGSTRILLGLRVTSPARTWLDLGSILELGDLVAVGDYLVHHSAPWVSVEELTTAVAGWRGRGIRTLRPAVALLDPRSESRPESRLRVMILQAGLPRPEINHALVDSQTGKHLRPDFRFSQQRVILEYQGDYHRTRAQWRKDMTRRSKLEAMGWYVMELNGDDLDDPQELVSRIAGVLSSRA